MRARGRTIAACFAVWAFAAAAAAPTHAQTAERVYRVTYLTLSEVGIQGARRQTLPLLEREGRASRAPAETSPAS